MAAEGRQGVGRASGLEAAPAPGRYHMENGGNQVTIQSDQYDQDELQHMADE